MFGRAQPVTSVSTSNVFNQSQPTLFGKPSTNTSVSSSYVFGQSQAATNPSLTNPFGQQQANLGETHHVFGQPSANSLPASSNVFGHTPTARFGFSSDPTPVFGQTKTSQSPPSSVSHPVFGGPSQTQITGQSSTSNSFLLGLAQTGSNPDTSNVFKASNTISHDNPFMKSTNTNHPFSQNSNLFAKPMSSTASQQIPKTSGMLFGKSPGMLFGKQPQTAGKSSLTSAHIHQPKVFFGKTFDESDESLNNVKQHRDNDQMFGSTLFGKRVKPETQHDDFTAAKSRREHSPYESDSRQGGRGDYSAETMATDPGVGFGKVEIPVPYTKPLFPLMPSMTGDTLFGKPQPQTVKVDQTDEKKLRKLQRLDSLNTDVSHITAIVCKDLHPAFANKDFLKDHFSQFGEVTRIIPSNDSAIIHFKTHEAADNARTNGYITDERNKDMQIFWRNQRRPLLTGLDQQAKTAGEKVQVLFGDKKPIQAEPDNILGTRPVDRTKRTSTDHSDEKKLRKLQRLDSLNTDVSHITAIVCKDLHPAFANKDLLKDHFSQFGEVTRIIPSNDSAIIHFKTHEAADNARTNGYITDERNKDMQIFWRNQRRRGVVKATSRRSEDDELANRVNKDTNNPLFSPRSRIPSAKRSASNLLQRAIKSATSRSASSLRSAGESRSVITSSKVTERSSSPASIVDISTPANVRVLLTGLDQQAKTAGEKVQVLENRDKLLRLGRTKSGTLANASVVVGTCEYMCTEKEWYDRQNSRRLSMYEVLAGTEHIPGQAPRVDHTRAVKEYSRSSADKEEPLPHELRPGPVLVSTMDYLLSEVADKGVDGQWGEWFDFLWNRTRSIRKDITQQMLCDHTAVALTERATRFHIFCSQRLCEEDKNDFEPKINDENLTKCLQSLKELYHDMYTKTASMCAMEAEFRAYMVLMNLNEGDTLREVQQLRRDIRESAEIKFVLKVYSALNSHNYVRFFKLVKVAPYLCACIMHRYFTQVRAYALEVMMRAYTSSGKSTQYPLSSMKEMLACETTQEVAEFCRHYGLHVADNHVILDRATFVQPENAFPTMRAKDLIESRLQVTVGEVINGGVIPPIYLLTPNTTFDENGYYIGDVPTITDAPTSSEDTPLATTSPTVLPYSNEAVKLVAREFFHEIIQESCHEIAFNVVTAIQVYMRYAEDVITEMTTDVADSDSREICASVHADATHAWLRQQEEMRRKEADIADRMAVRERGAAGNMEHMLGEVIGKIVESMARDEMASVKEELHRQCIERSTNQLAVEVTQEVTDNLLAELAEEVHRSDIIERDEQLSHLCGQFELRHASKFWFVWKRVYVRKTRFKRAKLTFPCEPSSASAEEQIQALVPHQASRGVQNNTMYLNEFTRRHIALPVTPGDDDAWLVQRLGLSELIASLKRQRAYAPLDVAAIVGEAIRNQTPDKHGLTDNGRYYMKFVLALPTTERTQTGHQTCDVFCDWIKRKFQRVKLQRDHSEPIQLEMLQLTSAKLERMHGEISAPTLNICVRGLTGTLTNPTISYITTQASLYGTTALWFVVSPNLLQIHREEAERLRSIILSTPPLPQKLLVIVLPRCRDQDIDIHDLLNLTFYYDNHLVSQIYELSMDYDSDGGVDVTSENLTIQLTEVVKWVANNLPMTPSLLRQNLRDFVEDQLSTELYGPVLHNLVERRLALKLHQPPEILIALYNSIIDRAIEATTDPTLSQYSWPVAEFSTDIVPWNFPDHFNLVKQTLANLYMPEFVHCDKANDDWSTACENVWKFVTSVLDDATGSHEAQFLSRVRSSVKRYEHDFAGACHAMLREGPCEPRYVNMPWTDIILAALDYKLHTTDFCYPDSQEEIVVYCDGENTQVECPRFWRDATRAQYTEGEPDLSVTLTVAAGIKSQENNEHSTDESVSETTAKLIFPVFKHTPRNIVDVKHMCSSLETSLTHAKLENVRFNEFLQTALTLPDIPSPALNQNSRLRQLNDTQTPKKMLRFDEDQEIREAGEIVGERRESCHESGVVDINVTEMLTITDSIERLRLKLRSETKANEIYEEHLRSLVNS